MQVLRDSDDAMPPCLRGGGRVGALLRAMDWSAHPLGPPAAWPGPLRTAVSLMLDARQPVWVAWGPDLISLYNDAFLPICGARHPAGLGQPVAAVWGELMDTLAPLHAAVLAGEPQWLEDVPLALEEADGSRRTRWFSFSCTPLREDDGRVAGIFYATTETTERVLHAQRQAEALERERRVFQQSPSFVCTLAGPQHVFEFVNDAFKRLFGRAAVGLPVREAFPDLEGQGFFELLDRVYATGENYVARDVPIRLRRTADGPEEARRLDFVYAPIVDEHGRVTGIFCDGYDVTEASESQQALAEREEQLRLATEAAGVGLWDVNLVTGTRFWAPRVRAMFGITDDTPVTLERFHGLVHPDDRGVIDAAFQAACDPAVRAFYDVEYRATGEDGVLRWIAAQGRGLFDPAGRCVRVLGTAVDITRRKADAEALHRGEQALLARVRELSLLHETAMEIARGEDAPAVMAQVLQAALGLTGGAQAMLLLHDAAQDVLEVVASAGFRGTDGPVVTRVPRGAGACGTCLARRDPVVVADVDTDPVYDGWRDRARVGGYRAVHATPLLAADGQVLGVLGLFRPQPGRLDEREVRLVELLARLAAGWLEHRRQLQALREADRRKDEFLATLAHELRNPLAPIRNAVQLLEHVDGTRGLGELRALLDRQVTHMVRLVDDLMEASRISRGQIDLRREPLDIADVLRAAVESSRPLIEAGGHAFAFEPPPQRLVVDGDPVRLAQVFSNLLVNAARYTPRGGHIAVEMSVVATSAGERVRVAVRDDGIGVAPADLPRLFEMFTQVDRRHQGAQRGLGIGLSLARRLVEMHGGTVEAASPGPGGGSTFTVELPLAAPPAPAAAPARRVPTGWAVQRVLIVDDNQDAADTLALLVRSLGIEARAVHGGAQALALARSWPPELVLLDLGMPDMDGYEVARQLRMLPGLPRCTIVAVTGWGQQADRDRTQAGGFDQHLVKPVDMETLRAVLAATVPGGGDTVPS